MGIKLQLGLLYLNLFFNYKNPNVKNTDVKPKI